MKFSLKKTLIAFFLLLLLAQLIRPDKANPPVNSEESFSEDSELTAVFKRACYDCHSSETRYPWYSNIAPVSWMLSHHVQEGREHLNFSIWNKLPEKKKEKLREEIWEEIEEGEMPMKGYVLLHKEAKLTSQDLEKIKSWSAEEKAN